METVNLRNELMNLQKTIANGAIQFDVKGSTTKVAARQLIGMLAVRLLLTLVTLV